MGVRRRHLLSGAALAGGLAAKAAERVQALTPPLRVRIPLPPEPGAGPSFEMELLALALSKAQASATIETVSSQNWMRQIRQLQNGQADVAALPAVDGAYAGHALHRVNLPLRPGLLGLRLFLVRKDRVAELSAQSQSLAQLQRLRLGYGVDWVDAPLMERLGFRLVKARTAVGLYDLLHQEQCDFLSRGLNEVEPDMAKFGQGPVPLAVLPAVGMNYPLDHCFHVSPHRPELRAVLHLGLDRAQADGSWVELLGRHYGAALHRLAVDRRMLWPLPGYPAPEGVEPRMLDLARWLPGIVAGRPKPP